MTALPVIWLCGAPATGKSTVAWHLFHLLADQQIRVGYVDIDQLGMVHPAPESDPSGHQTKADALAAVMPNYQRAGAQVLVVSGVLDPVIGAAFAERVPSTTFCHLKLAEQALRARLANGSRPTESAEAAIAMMRGLDEASFITRTVDTDGRTPDDIASEVRALVEPIAVSPRTPSARPAQGDGHLIVICGPRAVGKSSVSWGLFMRMRDRGITTGYVDLDQLGFLGPAEGGKSALSVANVAAVWNTFRPLGARLLIANGQVDLEDAKLIRALFRSVNVRIVRLATDVDAYRLRIQQRLGGGPPFLIGDDLVGAPPEYQEDILREALAEERRYRSADPADEVIDTASLSIHEVADLIHQAESA